MTASERARLAAENAEDGESPLGYVSSALLLGRLLRAALINTLLVSEDYSLYLLIREGVITET